MMDKKAIEKPKQHLHLTDTGSELDKEGPTKNLIEKNVTSRNVERAISLADCDYSRNFGLTQCGCAG